MLAIARISALVSVFDWLDEAEELTRGVQRLQENTASIQVIVTNRPAAFANAQDLSQNCAYPLSMLRRCVWDLRTFQSRANVIGDEWYYAPRR
jgi:hypothetical protein